LFEKHGKCLYTVRDSSELLSLLQIIKNMKSTLFKSPPDCIEN
jgi:hypothetical protein